MSVLILVVAGPVAAAPPLEERVAALFRPLAGEQVALSPDGRRVAYTLPQGDRLALVIVDLENLAAKKTVPVDYPRENLAEDVPPPTALRFLRWASARRLVYAPAERAVALEPVADKRGRLSPNPDGPRVLAPILAVDADGRQRGALVDAADFQEAPDDARKTLGDVLRTPIEIASERREPVRWRMPHVEPLGFLPREREQLVFATHGAYSARAHHVVDTRTGQVRAFDPAVPPPAPTEVHDGFRLKIVGERRAGPPPATVWRDEELSHVQRELEEKFPRRVVELLGWSDDRARFLVRVTGGADAGRVFVHQRPEDLVLEVLRQEPWPVVGRGHETIPLAFTGADGARLGGWLTRPSQPRSVPPPLVVVLTTPETGAAPPAFDPEAQVLAELGIAVVRAGGGADGARDPIEDARAAVAALAGRRETEAIDTARTAVLGRGPSAGQALRGLERAPEVFRGAVAIQRPEAPTVTGTTTMRPVLLLTEDAVDPARSPATARAATYRRIAEFLESTLAVTTAAAEGR